LEADEGDLGKQLQIIKQLEIPCSCIVHSGGKSIHALVRVDAANMEEYQKRVDYLYGVARANGLKNDGACKNPSRLSRLPGFVRGTQKQYLIAERCGRDNWGEWVEFVEDKKDDLPSFENLGDLDFNNLPPKKKELIAGVLREGHKLALTGASKAGKTWDILELLAAFSCGGKWHGWQCTTEKTLYVNLEMDEISILYRVKDVFDDLGIDYKYRKMIDIWNLNGNSRPLDQLAPKLIRRAEKAGYKVIVIDPIYKVLTGDENNAMDMGVFTNLFDTIARRLKCAVVFCHHHSKGAQGGKRASDRGSGSGVFARHPDAILDLVELIITPEIRKQLYRCMGARALAIAAKAKGIDVVDRYGQDESGDPDALSMYLHTDFPKYADEFRDVLAKANQAAGMMSGWRIECTLREFAKPEHATCWFKFPTHIEDWTGMLDHAKADGEEPAWEMAARLKKEKKDQEKAEKAALDKERKAANAENAEAAEEHELAEATGTNDFDTDKKRGVRLSKAVEKCGGVGVATLNDVIKVIGKSEGTIKGWLKMSSIYDSKSTGKGCKATTLIVRRT